MDSQRFFIALVPPPEIQAPVNDIKRHFATHYDSHKALNSPPHITLQAPFEWPQGQKLENLARGLQDFVAGRKEFAIALRNFGAFPPQVIYIDVLQTPDLINLQQDLSAFMSENYGLSARRYPKFCPHMTVAFRDLTKNAFNQAWPEFRNQSLAFDFTAQTITLLRHGSQRWQIYQDYPLQRASTL